MLINDHPRCGRCKYWKAMRCINPESKMYEFQRFQRADGKCKLWQDGSGLFDGFDDEDGSDCKDGEIMTERETAQSAARSYRRAMLGNVYRHFKGATYVVDGIAVHSESAELMVIYHRVGDPTKQWVRPLEMFLSPVDKQKYPDAAQERRFEVLTDENK